MQTVLLITFAYPPSEFVGAVRPTALAKYLPKFGWNAIVLTAKTEGVSRQSKLVIETDYRDVLDAWKARLHLGRNVHEQFGLPLAKKPGSVLPHTRVLRFLNYLATYPDPFKGWIPFALAAVEETRRQKIPIAAIVTTSPPISAHLIGRQAKALLGCPWIADLRDLWTQNLANHNPLFSQIGLEKRTLGQADAIVTVSSPWASRLQQRFPDKKVWAIPNGFDPDDFCLPSPALTREFSITYTGQLYEGQRDPTVLFEVLRELIEEKAVAANELRVRFYGSIEPWLPALVQHYGLNQVVELHGPIPRKEVFERQRESQVLLALPTNNPNETGHHSAKLFEYFAAARPVVAVGGSPGVLTDALKETHAGVHALSKGQVRAFLLSAYAEYQQCGRVSYSGDSQAIGHYSHPEMARSFAEVLDSVVRHGQAV